MFAWKDSEQLRNLNFQANIPGLSIQKSVILKVSRIHFNIFSLSSALVIQKMSSLTPTLHMAIVHNLLSPQSQ